MVNREFFQVEQGPVAERISPVKFPISNRQPGQSSIEKIGPSASLPVIYLGTAGPQAKQVYQYAQHLAELLNAQIHPIPADLKELPPQAIENSSLLIYEEPEQSSRLKTWFCEPPVCRVVNCWPASVLVARQPRWPLNKILLVTRGRRLDYPAVTWVAHLARLVQANIIVLVIQPYLSTANSRALYGEGVGTWLTSDTPLGQQLRHIAGVSETVTKHIDLQFRGGSPEDQIWQAMAATQPDLIVVASEPVDWWERRILGELVRPLLCQTDRPVLVAKSGFCPR